MEQIHAYKIDLTKIEGKGDFPCPRCGTKISPDDKTEKTYSILELKVSSHGLEEIVIRCNRCYSHIHLTGFSLLQKIELAEEELKSRKPLRQFAETRAASRSRYKTVERQRGKKRNRCVTFLFLPAACLLWAIGWAMANA